MQSSFQTSATAGVASLRRRTNRATFLAIAVPHAGLAAALLQLAFGTVAWWNVGLLVLCYLITTGGVTLGYHRLLAHRSLALPDALATLVVAAGAMAGVGPPLTWVANHRRHHAKSDHQGDPHSPLGPAGPTVRSFLHGHCVWLFRHELSSPVTYARDLLAKPRVLRLNRAYHMLVILGVLLPGLAGWVLGGYSWWGVAQGVVWGGLARMALNQQAIWSLGSFGHVFGRQTFRSQDGSRNNMLLALLVCGEGWHNNHHAFPEAAVHGFSWHEMDATGAVIKVLQRLGVAKNVHERPAAQDLDLRRMKPYDQREVP